MQGLGLSRQSSKKPYEAHFPALVDQDATHGERREKHHLDPAHFNRGARGNAARRTRLAQALDKAGQHSLGLDEEIRVDLFCGGGGASEGIEIATGEPVTIAVNHDAAAIAMHMVNHPLTEHYQAGVHDVCPREAARGRRIGHLHASPDCTHFSQAKGGQPRSRSIRSLAWIVLRWAGMVRPRMITMENVIQMQTDWGPLIAKRDKATGRVLKLNGSVAEPGEVVPIAEQFLVPDPKRRGKTFRRFVRCLQHLGYAVEYRALVAADYGAPTTRERLYLVARCDGLPIIWPEQTHFRNPKPGQKAWRGAHECIDWTLDAPSIFKRQKDLAEATLRRVAKGIKRFVIDAEDRFVVPSEALAKRSKGLIAGDSKHALTTAFLAQANDGFNTTVGHDVRRPMSTITNSGSQQQLVIANLVTLRRHSVGQSARSPLPTIVAGGEHHAILECTLSHEEHASALRVARFLREYLSEHGTHTKPIKPVTLTIDGVVYAIVDIGLRMLQPHELYAAQGFPKNYIHDRAANGDPLTKTQQIRMCGNSVSPVVMAAIVAANDW